MDTKRLTLLIALVLAACGDEKKSSEECAGLSIEMCETTDGCFVYDGRPIDPKRNCVQTTSIGLFCVADGTLCPTTIGEISSPTGDRFQTAHDCGVSTGWVRAETNVEIISCDLPLTDKRVGWLTAEDISWLCGRLPDPTDCENGDPFFPTDRADCESRLEELAVSEPNQDADKLVRCWRDSCDPPYTGPCAPDCFNVSVERCDKLSSCRTFFGSTFDQENMCFTNTEVPLFCDFTDNCNNLNTVHRSPDGELFLGGSMCGLPPGWEWIEHNQARCE